MSRGSSFTSGSHRKVSALDISQAPVRHRRISQGSEVGSHTPQGSITFAKHVNAKSSKARLRSFPIPQEIMCSISIYLFALPETAYEGITYNTMALCVNRHSVWTVAIPIESSGPFGRGVTGEQIAGLLLRHQCDHSASHPSSQAITDLISFHHGGKHGVLH